MQPPEGRVNGLLGPVARRVVPEELDDDLADLLALEPRSHRLAQPEEALLEGGQHLDGGRGGIRAGLGQAAAGFVGNGLADFRRLREAGFDVHRLARSDAGQDAPLERRPEAIHLGRDVEGLVEDRRRVLHISVVDGDGNVGGWDRARVGARAKTAGALAHDLGEAVRRLFQRDHNLRCGDVLVREFRDDPVELVEADCRLPRGGVARKGTPELVLDVVEGGGVVAADADVGKDFRKAPGREGGAGVIRPCDDQGGFAAEGVGHDFDEPLARCEVARRDLAAVGKLGDERVVAAGEDRRGLARRGLDFVGAADQGDGESGGLEAHAGGQVRDTLGAVTGHDDHIDPVGDVAPGEEAVGRVDVGEVEVVLRASPAPETGPGPGGVASVGTTTPRPPPPTVIEARSGKRRSAESGPVAASPMRSHARSWRRSSASVVSAAASSGPRSGSNERSAMRWTPDPPSSRVDRGKVTVAEGAVVSPALIQVERSSATSVSEGRKGF